MVLNPKKILFKNRFKLRRFLSFKNSKLCFGNIGFKVMRPMFFNAKRIFRFKLFFKKLNKKSDKTKRKLWFNTFPFFPLTKKPQGLRMGKGKGKLNVWFSKIYPGTILVQVKNIRPGRAIFFFNQLNYRVERKGLIVFAGPKYDTNLKVKKLPIYF